MQPAFRAAALLLFSFWPATARAQNTVTMFPIPVPTGVEPKIEHGRLAIRADWPMTLPFRPGLINSTANCTGTVIGDRVIVTAAHCVANGGNANAIINNKQYKMKCNHHEQYRGEVCSTVTTPQNIVGCTADIALCLVDAPIATSSKFERIERPMPAFAPNSEVTLLGFGCTVGGGAMSPDLNVGQSPVEWMSEPGASSNPLNTYREYIKTHGAAAICYGDSGGAAYTSENPETRELLGINSRGHMSTDSYLVNVLDPHIFAFMKKFANDNAVRICGIDDNAANCRN